MEIVNASVLAVLVAFLLLLAGDFVATFLYHVPEHVFGKFHNIVHHSKNRNFLRYAVLTKNPWVLLNGMLPALSYCIFTPWLWQISPVGTLLGLVLGELHVTWRHVSLLDWPTPTPLKNICNILCITTPERHWLHHRDASVAYGDIFTFYDEPARIWLGLLMSMRQKSMRQKVN
ncbi:MAG: sterol desaturase family protein [Leptolyngbyaceae bacterium]|nr:sterol desaturase family protein [Leptolyngbyaceae bacterium]